MGRYNIKTLTAPPIAQLCQQPPGPRSLSVQSTYLDEGGELCSVQCRMSKQSLSGQVWIDVIDCVGQQAFRGVKGGFNGSLAEFAVNHRTFAGRC
jgi:hypothetical protein